MIHLRITPDAGAATLAPAVSALHDGGVVAFPTETFYGLAVDPRSALAVKRVFEIKRRPPDHPLPLIASDVDQVVDHVGTMTPLAARLASRGWPGPLTLIIPASPRLCDDVHLSTGRVAVRVPANRVARAARAQRRPRHHVHEREYLRRTAGVDAGTGRGVARRRHRCVDRRGPDARRVAIDHRRRDRRRAGTGSRAARFRGSAC